MEQTELNNFYQKSQQPETCEKLFKESLKYIKDQGLDFKSHQEKALLNHIAEMIRRDTVSEPINIDDKSVFNELSRDSVEKAENIVNQLEHQSENEVLLLAVHFEVAKYN